MTGTIWLPFHIRGQISAWFYSAHVFVFGSLESNIGTRTAASIEAEEIVNFKTSDFLEWEKVQSINQFINCYRAQAEKLSNKEIEIALKELKKGSDAEEIIRIMGKRLSRKLIHTPTSKLREYAGEAEILRKAIEILGIDVENR